MSCIDCMIVVPSFEDQNAKHDFSNREMLGPSYIAAAIMAQNYKFEYWNSYTSNVSSEFILERINKTNPTVLAITCASQRGYPSVRSFVKEVHKSGFKSKIVLGGFYAGLESRNILVDLKEVDFINIGEGEVSFPRLLKMILNGQLYGVDEISGIAYRIGPNIVIKPADRLQNLDFDFFPLRERIDHYAVSNMINGKTIPGKYYNMIVGRGCYGKCSFCSICKYDSRNVRYYRSPKNIVDEIKHVLGYGVQHIWFNDEIFYERSEKGQLWLSSFVKAVKESGIDFTFNIELRPNDVNYEELLSLKEIGLSAVFIGIESGVQRILNEMRKGTTIEINRRALEILTLLDLHVEMGWISLIPTMRFNEMVENYKFLFSTRYYTEENIYNKLNLYNGCEYQNILRENGLLSNNTTFYDRFGYDYLDSQVKTFSQIIDYARSSFSDVKRLTTWIQNAISESGDYKDYLEIRGKQRAVWTDFVMELIFTIERNDEYSLASFIASQQHDILAKKIKIIEDYVKSRINILDLLSAY